MSLNILKNFRLLVITMLAIVTLSIVIITNIKPVSAQFDPLGESCKTVTDSDVCRDSANPGDPLNGEEGIFNRVVNLLSFLAGIVAVIIIFIAGLTMITSQGDPGKVKSSRDAIIYAAVGIAVIVLARSIIIFVYNRVS